MADGFDGYDAWKTRSDDPGTVGRGEIGLAYCCLDCSWTGRGGAAVVAHHRERHHRIRVRNGPELPFRCCQDDPTDAEHADYFVGHIPITKGR